MNTSSPQTRKTYDAAPYATLRSDGVTAHAQPGQPSPPAAETAFAQEAEHLRMLRHALWDAFSAGAEGGLPTTLIDLTIAYTTALRLQLNLQSLQGRRLAPPRSATPAGLPRETPANA